jgi:hypothetical protein
LAAIDQSSQRSSKTNTHRHNTDKEKEAQRHTETESLGLEALKNLAIRKRNSRKVHIEAKRQSRDTEFEENFILFHEKETHGCWLIAKRLQWRSSFSVLGFVVVAGCFCMGGIDSESGGEREWALIAARRDRRQVEEQASSRNQQQQLRLMASMCRI